MGPITQHILAGLKARAKQHNLIYWLDPTGEYTELVDQLIQDPEAAPCPIYGFRGSHLKLMIELEDKLGGLTPPRLVVHLPGFDGSGIRKTPLLELTKAGTRHQVALPTAIREVATGQVKPDDIDAFLAQRPTLIAAEAWLADATRAVGEAVGLDISELPLTTLVISLLRREFDHADAERLSQLWQALIIKSGVPEAWLAEGPITTERMASAITRWALTVEFAQDLGCPPQTADVQAAKALKGPLADACQALCAELRETLPAQYISLADDAEAQLGVDAEIEAQALGAVDTFRFEEERILQAAIDALAAEDWARALSWAAARTGETFWSRQTAERGHTWALVHGAARLGAAMIECGYNEKALTPDEALESYVAHGAHVDQAHRHLEQLRARLLFPTVPKYSALRARLDDLRTRWRDWADGWAVWFNGICESHGPLPAPNLRQRSTFAQAVKPLMHQGPVVLCLVDALRYEMAQELSERLAGGGTQIRMQAALSELPSVTEIGMNCQPPLLDGYGRLSLEAESKKIKGFRQGNYRVDSPKTREQAFDAHAGEGGAAWLSLADVLQSDLKKLTKALKGKALVVMHATEIDEAGEKGLGPAVFDLHLQQLQAAWQLLRDAGLKQFVFTADHGFLIMEGLSAEALPHGPTKLTPKARYVVSPYQEKSSERVCFSTAHLEYQCDPPLHFIMPRDTRLFDRGARNKTFAHGGNSLQERVIPWLTVLHGAPRGDVGHKFVVQAVAQGDSLEIALKMEGLQFAAPPVALTLHAVDVADARVEITSVKGAAVSGGLITMEVGTTAQLRLDLRGLTEGRSRIEIRHPAAQADPVRTQIFFPVQSDRPATDPGPEDTVPTDPGEDWLQALPEAVQPVFKYIHDHGTIDEPTLARMLGSPRSARRFALKMAEYVALAPFDLRIDYHAGSKRYTRTHQGAAS